MTGGSVRLGLAISTGLLDAGFEIAVHYCASVQGLTALAQRGAAQGVRVEGFKGDFTEQRAPLAVAEAMLASFGRLDLLVNNAAVFLSDDADARALAKMKLVNVDAPQRLILALTPALTQSRGCIVNIADVAGLVPFARHRAYSRSKAVLIERTRAEALRLAPCAVRVNCLCPGTVLPAAAYDEQKLEALRRGIPLGRCGEPSDVVRAVVFLAESPFITGQILCVDGGRSLVAAQSADRGSGTGFG